MVRIRALGRSRAVGQLITLLNADMPDVERPTGKSSELQLLDGNARPQSSSLECWKDAVSTWFSNAYPARFCSESRNLRGRRS
jgi:hypothetical protein